MSVFENISLNYSVYCSDEVFIWVKIIVAWELVVGSNQIVQLKFIAQEATNATKSFTELKSVRWLVCDEVDVNAEFLIIHDKPVAKLVNLNHFQI